MVNNISIRFLNNPNDIKESALNTINKEVESTLTPQLFFKYLITEHSPIRTLILRTVFHGMNVFTSVHFARHVHSLPFVTTNRPDRTGKERSVTDTVNHMMDTNCQALIDMARKRLCKKCSKDTQDWMHQLKYKLMTVTFEDSVLYEFYKELGKALVPNCVYRGMSCPEVFSPCGFISKFEDTEALSIIGRYEIYNKEFMLKTYTN